MTRPPIITYHGPDPVAGPKCDACFVREPAWHHPANVFTVRDLTGAIMVLGAEGALSACTECSDDFQAGEAALPRLEARALEALGSMGEAYRHKLRPFLHRLHHGMVLNLAGPRRPAGGARLG